MKSNSKQVNGIYYLGLVKALKLPGARSKVWGVSGSEDRGGGDDSIQFINIGRAGDKGFKEWRQKIGGWKGGDNNILTFYATGSTKKCHLKTEFGQYFSFVYVKFLNS